MSRVVVVVINKWITRALHALTLLASRANPSQLCSTYDIHPPPKPTIIIIIINPCKPYLSASATAPHPLGRRKAD
jgi:hypothetical protein